MLKNKKLKKYVKKNPEYKVAFIIDDEVVEIISCNEKLCAILTSNPVAFGYKVDPNVNFDVNIGWKYQDGKFTVKNNESETE